mmetsp:Transcript_34023/g.79574  ORF Transcript_34023/g.79574 Transcript_34023/m.79574 type:complete len:224 (-) Transcript_34023:1302-1973(-)
MGLPEDLRWCLSEVKHLLLLAMAEMRLGLVPFRTLLIGERVEDVQRFQGSLSSLLHSENQVDPTCKFLRHVRALKCKSMFMNEVIRISSPIWKIHMPNFEAILPCAKVNPRNVDQTLRHGEELRCQLSNVRHFCAAGSPALLQRPEDAISHIVSATLQCSRQLVERLHTQQKMHCKCRRGVVCPIMVWNAVLLFQCAELLLDVLPPLFITNIAESAADISKVP